MKLFIEEFINHKSMKKLTDNQRNKQWTDLVLVAHKI